MIVEGFNAALGERVDRFAVDAAPFLEAAERGGVGIVGIEREQDEFVEMAGGFEGGDGVFGERLPVAHGGDGYGIDVGLEGADKAGALAFGEDGDGRAAADHGVASGDGRRALFCDVAREGAADEIERAQGNDVGIEEEIAQEGFDGGERIRAAQLEEDDADAFFCGGHGDPFFGALGLV